MKYIDILSESVSHFTDIPKDFVKEKFEKFESNKIPKSLLVYIYQIEFPELEGEILLEDLKDKNLSDTIKFFIDSIKMIRQETERQARLN